MEPALAVVTGIVFSAGVYALLQGHLFRMVVGFVLISNSVNLLIFSSGRLSRGQPPLIAESRTVPSGPVANPLSSALILTSIVITFGLIAYLIMLVFRSIRQLNTLTPIPGAEEEDEPEEGGK